MARPLARERVAILLAIFVLVTVLLFGGIFWQVSANGIAPCGEPVPGEIVDNRWRESEFGTFRRMRARLSTGREVVVEEATLNMRLGETYRFQQFCDGDGQWQNWVKEAR